MNITIDLSEKINLKLKPSDAREAMKQNIYCLLNTTIAEVPCYREFGLDKRFVSMPMSIGQSMLVSAIAEAFSSFFPEFKIEKTDFETNSEQPDWTKARIEVSDSNE